jgi:hypothetical protein
MVGLLKGIGSVLMLTIVLESFLVVFTASVTGGVVRRELPTFKLPLFLGDS